MIAFGPVPSRRLGRSLGVNNIPNKVCTYACVYCQIGKTLNMDIKRKTYFSIETIFNEVKAKVEKAKARNEQIDYITFVPDGEPTLDINLGKEIKKLKSLGIPIAVITNASLIWREDVAVDLSEANLVSLKVDAVSNDIWKRINRPHKELQLEKILEGILEFRKSFQGIIITETMLIDGIEYNDEFEKIANFLKELKPNKAYIAVPTRPPCENWVKPAKEETINQAYQAFARSLGTEKVEYLIGYEGNEFAFTGDAEKDLLSIISVHPMREDAIKEFLSKANADWTLIEKLLKDKKIVEITYEGKKFYMRKLKSLER
ncbi:MAG: radical SAM protein [Candidatus Asgardarchaeia archaeon]